MALSWQAGAQLHALTLVPFHPTALTKLGAPHFLISEAVRGERIQVQLWQEVLAAYEVNHFLGQISPAQNVQFACPDSSSRAYGQMKLILTICKQKGCRRYTDFMRRDTLPFSGQWPHQEVGSFSLG